MPAQVFGWMFSVQVSGGPTISAANTFPVEGYQRLRIELDVGASDQAVAIAPSPIFLVITSSAYGVSESATEQVSYKLSSGGAAIKLTGPLMLIGKSAVEKFVDTGTLESILFSNSLTHSVTLDILLAQDAT